LYRASANKQGQLKKYVDNIHDKFNARVNDRLEKKHVDDNIKVTNNYRDYVLSTKKKIELVATKQKDKVDAHEYKMKLQKDKV